MAVPPASASGWARVNHARVDETLPQAGKEFALHPEANQTQLVQNACWLRRTRRTLRGVDSAHNEDRRTHEATILDARSRLHVQQTHMQPSFGEDETSHFILKMADASSAQRSCFIRRDARLKISGIAPELVRAITVDPLK